MRKLAALAGATALGLGLQSAANAYTTQAAVTFTVGGSASFGADSDQAFVATAAAIQIGAGIQPTNSTLVHLETGANSRGTYNQNFAQAGDCVAGGGVVPGTGVNISVRKYGCRYDTPILGSSVFAGIPNVDGGPGTQQASGTIKVTDTAMTGTLTIVSTTDEPTGATTVISTSGGQTTRISNSVGDGTNGYNYRSADGSPFGNYWTGVSTAGTYTLALTGTFNNTTWNVTGGSASFTDPNFACQQGGFGGDDRGTLCTSNTTAGSFTPTGGAYSWGMDVDGVGPGGVAPIPMTDPPGTTTLATLSGVIANLSIGVGGAITTNSGEIRRALGNSSGCPVNIEYDAAQNKLSCGNLTASALVVTGTAVGDTDGDGIGDSLDNCRLTANPTQLDSNQDGYGNICDADLNNSNLTTSTDFNLQRSVLNQSAGSSALAAAADMNGSGLVTSTDFNLLRARLNTAPGPSGLACAGTIPCLPPP